MKRIAAIITGIALALALSGVASAGNWNSQPPPERTNVNWSS